MSYGDPHKNRTKIYNRDLVFNISLDFFLFILLILVGVELPLCIVVTLSQNAITCFLESSRV